MWFEFFFLIIFWFSSVQIPLETIISGESVAYMIESGALLCI